MKVLYSREKKRMELKKQRARSREEKNFRKDKILNSAKKLFSRHGFQKTSIEMIMDDSSLSPASFYLYFKSKLQIYRTLTLQGTMVLENMIQELLKENPQKASESLESLASTYLDFFIKEREYYDIITVLHLGQREFFEDTDMVPVLEEASQKLLSLLSSIIEQGIKNGEFRPVDSWKTACTLWGMIDGILMMEVRMTTGYIGMEVSELVQKMIEILMKGLIKN